MIIDASARFDKRHKAVHRYEIIDTRDRLQLTVPIIKPHGVEGRTTWADVGISPHGEWWRLHLTALESAYGRTPYFEFLIDKFSDIFCDPRLDIAAQNILELDKRADYAVRQILDIRTNVIWESQNCKITDSERFTDFATPEMEQYYQIRAHKLGFVASLSILDLIFNLGPEAGLYIDRLSERIK